MGPSIVVGVLWLLFGGTHVGLATRRVRGSLVARFGEGGFTALFSGVAVIGFVALVGVYATERDQGAAGLALANVPAARWILLGIIAGAMALLVASLVAYDRSTYAIFRATSRSEPRGLERVTRHPFFVGAAILGVAHALLATRLVGTVFFAGLALFAFAGAVHQDRKLLATRGAAHATFMSRTSLVPFAAILGGRTHLPAGELPLGSLAAGLLVAWALRLVHPSILAHGGAYVVIVVVGGAAIATLQAWQRQALPPGRSRTERLLGPALIAIGMGHVVAALVIFPQGLADIVRAGVLDTIAVASPPERQAAFWFILFTPVLALAGQVASQAVARDDRRLLATLAWYLTGIAALGALVMPVSGFWAVLAVGLVMLRTAHRRPIGEIGA
jgi:uncharacterized membrane protein